MDDSKRKMHWGKMDGTTACGRWHGPASDKDRPPRKPAVRYATPRPDIEGPFGITCQTCRRVVKAVAAYGAEPMRREMTP